MPDRYRIIQGDCLTTLPDLPAQSVHTCVTSPPYFGLRDYGHDGQIGLEPTPDEFVAALVEVFREVRRVLRDDGTVWLNLGSSYFGAPTTGGCSPKSTLTGGGGKYRSGSKNETMFSAASRGSDASQSRQPQRAPAYDSDGTEPQDSPGPGSACPDLCDGCRAVTQSHHVHSDCTDPLPAQDEQPPAPIGRGSEHLGCGPTSPGASPLDAPASTTPRSSEPPPGGCSHCVNCGACLSVLRSSSRDARLCARTGARMNDTGSLGTDASGMAWVNYTRRLKPKDMIPIPWMVAMALQADGWYLRSEIIWAKPNPMPESVTDRPTKAHEQIFLLSKSPRYYYDADAIREAGQYEGPPHSPGRQHLITQTGGVITGLGRAADGLRRNKRSVWTVATQPYPGAHFATFPPKLIEPCILAGCPNGGIVLDPFAGACSTGLAALRNGRAFIGIELNPEYAALGETRLATDLRLGHRHPVRVAASPSQLSLGGDTDA